MWPKIAFVSTIVPGIVILSSSEVSLLTTDTIGMMYCEPVDSMYSTGV